MILLFLLAIIKIVLLLPETTTTLLLNRKTRYWNDVNNVVLLYDIILNEKKCALSENIWADGF